MKKTFTLTHPKKAYPRMVEATKNEIRKYIKRERKKTLPTGMDFWDFDCQFGLNEAEAETIHLSEIDAKVNEVAAQALTEFYLEILAVAKRRNRPEPEPAPGPPKPSWKPIEEEKADD